MANEILKFIQNFDFETLKIKTMTTFCITIALSIGVSIFTFAQSIKKVPETKVIMTINVPIDTAFIYIVPTPLERLFKKYKRFPAITSTSKTNGWATPGLSRTIYFEDGTTSQETLLTYVPNISFSYKVEKFTSQLRFLAKRIEGNWLFTDISNGQTKIEWTYKVIPKNFIARGLIKVFLLKDIEGLLKNALIILKNDLESSIQE